MTNDERPGPTTLVRRLRPLFVIRHSYFKGGFMTPTTYALTGATLIDGTGAAPQRGMTVVVEGRAIAAVGPDGATAVPDGATRYDLAGRTLMPGLIDGHVHLLAYAGSGQKDVHLWNVLT